MCNYQIKFAAAYEYQGKQRIGPGAAMQTRAACEWN